ncbi:MAG: alkaline phosphatase, partial [Pseudomonadota bacterium]
MRRRNSEFLFKVIMLAIFIFLSPMFQPSAMAAERAKNVIVLIADGCSSEQYTLARWVKGRPLSFDPIRVGALKTYIADSVIADSAPAASAFATGVRTKDKFISVGPDAETLTGVPVPSPELSYKPLATVLEGARLLNKATGIVSTSRVTHATPAAYVAHTPSRNLESDIMEQAVYQNIDVVFGGGKGHLLPKALKGKRPDNENLLEVLKKRGYRIAENREDMMALSPGRAFGMFASSHMDAEIDRKNLHPEQPTLKEMTEKAIHLLSGDPDGFFLMVEGSQIDWACHANDPAHLI